MKILIGLLLAGLGLQQKGAPDYAPAMAKVASRFKGKEGVVLHIGDSITYANPYGGWARYGRGKTARDKAVLKWMHLGADDETDGWYLARVDRPGGRSDTAVSGITSYQYLAGGKAGIPPLAEVVRKYNPQIAVVMLGTNDATAKRSPAQFRGDMIKVVDTVLANGTIPILSTLPPYKGKEEVIKQYNGVLMEIIRAKKLPMIDYWSEIMKRRPTDWFGTLISKDGVHPSAKQGSSSPGSEPTEEHLKNSGFLLRGWLSVQKIAEVKERVVDRRRR